MYSPKTKVTNGASLRYLINEYWSPLPPATKTFEKSLSKNTTARSSIQFPVGKRLPPFLPEEDGLAAALYAFLLRWKRTTTNQVILFII
jgi:hypothetical protein